jgi:hypothetical protein
MFLNVLIHFSWYGNVNLIFLLLAEPLFAFLYFEFPFIKFQRPNAKDLLKHRFIRNARKSPRLLERIRCDILLLSITLPLKLIWFPKFFLFPSSLSLFFFFFKLFFPLHRYYRYWDGAPLVIWGFTRDLETCLILSRALFPVTVPDVFFFNIEKW